MSLDPITLPKNSNYEFVIAITEAKFGQLTKQYLDDKRAFYEQEKKKPLLSKIGLQVAHILMMPYRVTALALQTISDVATLAIASIATVFTLGLNERIRHELKARAYNLLVADIIAWASLPISILFRTVYIGANSLHLGTTRFIDMESKDEADINKLAAFVPEIVDNDDAEVA